MFPVVKLWSSWWRTSFYNPAAVLPYNLVFSHSVLRLSPVTLLRPANWQSFKPTQNNRSNYTEPSLPSLAAVRINIGINVSEEFAASIFMVIQDRVTISSAVRTSNVASQNETVLQRSTQVSRISLYYPQADIGSTSDVSLVDHLLTWHDTVLYFL
jgi:hypothetical protein